MLFAYFEVVGLGLPRTELPYQSRHRSYGVEVCTEASEHEQDHDEGRCTLVLRCLLEHKDQLLILCQFQRTRGEDLIEHCSYPARRRSTDNFRITDVKVECEHEGDQE